MFRTIAVAIVGLVLAFHLSIWGGESQAATNPAASAQAGRQSHSVENENYDFDYSYPAQAAAIPQVRAFMERKLRASEAEIRGDAEAAKKEAKTNGYPYFPHYLSVGWDVAADLPGWLSLSAAIETYTGGAHGNHAFDGLLWDKKARKMRKPAELFRSRDALRKAIRSDFCRLLDAERAERRGEPVPPGSDDMFDACIDPLESTIVLSSQGRKAFDTIDVLVAPYMAGPYVEGTYAISVLVTDAIMEEIKPEFRYAFTVKR